MSSKKTHELDARRLLCPMPIIRVQTMIEELGADAYGDHLEVRCTDPGVLYDIPAWAKVHGHSLVSKQEKDHEFFVTIKIGSDD